MHVRRLLLPTTFLLALAVALPLATTASGAPILHTNRSCYLVGQPVAIMGTGFAPARSFEVALDGIDFGISTTDSHGSFTASLRPGGLGANIVQAVETLAANDGTSGSKATITITRKTGARILAGSGRAGTLRAPFQVWGFALGYPRPAIYTIEAARQVFLHYVSPLHRLKRTFALGRVRGQCGYLKTGPRRVFPFTPAPGLWTLQLDSHRRYAERPTGPVAQIRVQVA